MENVKNQYTENESDNMNFDYIYLNPPCNEPLMNFSFDFKNDNL